MSKKIPVDELLRLACLHAEVSLEMSDEQPDRNLAAQIHEYRVSRWGMSPRERALSEAVPVPAEKVVASRESSFVDRWTKVIKGL